MALWMKLMRLTRCTTTLPDKDGLCRERLPLHMQGARSIGPARDSAREGTDCVAPADVRHNSKNDTCNNYN